MKELKLQTSCEIDNLIEVIAERIGKTYAEVEKASYDEYLFPESGKTYVDVRWPSEHDRFFKLAIRDMLKEKGLQGIYITYPI